MFLGNVRLEVRRLEQPEEQLVDELQVRPRRLQRRLIFLWVEFRTVRIR